MLQKEVSYRKIDEEFYSFVKNINSSAELIYQSVEECKRSVEQLKDRMIDYQKSKALRNLILGFILLLMICIAISVLILFQPPNFLFINSILMAAVITILFYSIYYLIFEFQKNQISFLDSQELNARSLEIYNKDIKTELVDMLTELKHFRDEGIKLIDNERAALEKRVEEIQEREKIQYHKKSLEIEQIHQSQFKVVENEHKSQLESIKEIEFISRAIRNFAVSLQYFGINLDHQLIDEGIVYFTKMTTVIAKEYEFEEKLMKFFSKRLNLTTNIIGFTGTIFSQQRNDYYWELLKENKEDLNQFFNLLVESQKVNIEGLEENKQNLFLILRSMKHFSFSGIRRRIANIKNQLNLLKECYNYLLIKGFQIDSDIDKCVELLTNLSTANQDFKLSNIKLSEINRILNAFIEIQLHSDFNQILMVMYILFLHDNYYFSMLDNLLKQLSNESLITKSLWYLISNKDELSDNYVKHWTNIQKEDIELHIDQTTELYSAFAKYLMKGKLITNSDILFNSLIKERQFQATEIIRIGQLNERQLPFDFDNAIKRVFSTKVSDNTFFKLLAYEKEIKPFLLTFDTKKDTGGIADELDRVISDFSIEKYTRSARIGILNDEYPSLEDIEQKVLCGLQDLLYKEKMKPFIEEYSLIIEEMEGYLSTNHFNCLKNQFESFKHNIMKCTSPKCINQQKEKFMAEIHSIFDIQSMNEGEPVVKNLIKTLKRNSPLLPEYQVLVHRIADSSKTVRNFGTFSSKDPLRQIKQLYTEISKKEHLLASMKYDEKLSIKQTLEIVLKNLRFFELASVEVPEIREDEKFMTLLSEEVTMSVMNAFGNGLNDTLAFADFITEKAQLEHFSGFTIEQFSKEYPNWAKNLAPIVNSLNNILQKEIKELSEVPSLCEKISSAIVKSLLCVSLVLRTKMKEEIENYV